MIDSYQSLVLAARGRLHEAARASERLVERCGNLPIWPVIGAHTQLGALAYERDDLATAEGHLSQALALGQQSGQEGLLAQTYLALAQLRQAQGACAEAQALCERAAQAASLLGNRPMALRAGTVRAALSLAQGDCAEAQRWRAARDLPPDGPISFYHEQSYLLLARLLQAEAEHWRALALLQQIERLALAQGRLPGRLVALTLQARSHSAVGDLETALGCLGRALALGRPEGFARCFLDEGAPVRDLLLRLRNTRHARRPADPQLRADAARLLGRGLTPRVRTDPEPPPALVEALTPREREVLRLLAEGAPNQEIARQLVLAPATVKKHITNILGKLEACNRTQAVARARSLNLL
jgi:LuxR family maltose regulon positive regulatory protein